MYRIMLLDDEPGVRNSIKAKIDWEAAGYRIDWEGANGLEALELLEQGAAPDLIITDIRMPKMDGIAFAKTCKEKYPGLRLVMLSGYSDFEYAKAAIQLGVRDYLLKPLIRQELINLLAAVALELENDRERQHRRRQEELQADRLLLLQQEQLIWRLVKDEWYAGAAVKERMRQLQLEELARDEFRARFVVAEMRIPRGRLDEGQEERKDLLQLAFQLLCRECAERRSGIYPLYDISHPAMMYFLLLMEPQEGKDGAEDFAHELERNICHYLRVDCAIGIGETVRELRQMKNGYASCMLSWSQRSGSRGGTRQAGLAALPELARTFTPELEMKLIQAMENGDMAAFERHLDTLYAPDTPMYGFTFLTLRIILLFTAAAKRFELEDTSLQQYLWNCQKSVRDYGCREQVLGQLRDLAGLVMEEIRKTRSSGGLQMMPAILKYVEENYPYELTLTHLAERFHLNETYLSGLFKQAAGATFSEHVTRLRLEKAAALLEENELKLTDIATLVGYSSPSYFSTAFKKSYGISPKEYREQMLQR